MRTSRLLVSIFSDYQPPDEIISFSRLKYFFLSTPPLTRTSHSLVANIFFFNPPPPDENISFSRFKYNFFHNPLTRTSHSLVSNLFLSHQPPNEKISFARLKYSCVPPPDENISFSHFKYSFFHNPLREGFNKKKHSFYGIFHNG